MSTSHQADFLALTPEVVLEAVEAALARRFEPLTQTLPSYVNRVYGLRTEEGEALVAKFYRPGRWPTEALHEEQQFVKELAEAEIPVVAPMELRNGGTLGLHAGIAFALFPRRGGRPFEPVGAEAWMRIGALIGRIHQVGATGDALHRRDLHPDAAAREDLGFLLAGDFMLNDERERLGNLGEELIEVIGPLFDDIAPIRLHGDFQRTNILEHPAVGLQPIDFDDMVNGPAVQDLWLLLPDSPECCVQEIDWLLRGYERFMPFERGTLQLIEPLRAMRMIHYLAWCARQYRDYNFAQTHADWGTVAFWRSEIDELEDQFKRLPSNP
jgi:Ser/Thr protein kinase RdoA (MazF antagonist)